MDDKCDTGNAFAIPYILTLLPSLTLDTGWGPESQELLPLLDKGSDIGRAYPSVVDLVVAVDDGHYPQSVIEDTNQSDLCLPILENFDINTRALESLTTPELSASSSQLDLSLSLEVDDEDIWAIPDDLFRSFPEVKARNWERFHDKGYKLPRNAYISEAGPEVFNALQNSEKIPHSASNATGETKERAIRQDILLKSILYLILGRDSVSFRYDDNMLSFVHRSKGVRISGYSLESSQSLIHLMIDRGNKTKSLKAFIDGTYSSRASYPALIALANAVSSILYKLHSIIGEEVSQLRSVLQLKSLVREPGEILDCLCRLVRSLGKYSHDRELLSGLYEFSLKEESVGGTLRSVLVKLLGQASRPWLKYLSEQMGLAGGTSIISQFPYENMAYNDQSLGPLSSKTDDLEAMDQRVDERSIPRFVMEDQAEIIFETTKSLQILRRVQPDHPLSQSGVALTAHPLSLEWAFSWQDVERIQDRAKKYEQSIKEAIEDYYAGSFSGNGSGRMLAQEVVAPCISKFGTSTTISEADITASIEEFEKPILASNNNHRRPRINASRRSADLVDDGFCEHSTILELPISLTASLSFGPVFSAQARLVNRSCLRLVLEQNHLRSHLSLLHRFSLFGDGLFASRLSHALFDSDMNTAERSKDKTRSGISGLRLGIRRSWPPASSELRIVLMGVLSEAYHNSINPFGGLSSHGALPGGLSFAIRDISETELQKCMDPNTIEALDFLRLQYKPPPPLDIIIDTTCLNKYDGIFKLLLRGRRMLYVVNHLFRDIANRSLRTEHNNHKDQHFRTEAHHFVTALCCCFVDGVETAWSAFARKLDEVEEHLRGDCKTDIGGLHSLRAWHEKMLDEMMFALLLRKRQTAVTQLMEEILNLILRFARCSQAQGSSERQEQDIPNEVEGLYGEFRQKVGLFVKVCKGLVETRGIVRPEMHQAEGRGFFGQDATSEAASNTIDQLLLRLDMNGYYSKPCRS